MHTGLTRRTRTNKIDIDKLRHSLHLLVHGVLQNFVWTQVANVFLKDNLIMHCLPTACPTGRFDRSMRLNWWMVWALLCVFMMLLSVSNAADSPRLYGIHWYGDTGATDVEDMSEGKLIYVMDEVLPYGKDVDNPSNQYVWEQAWWRAANLYNYVTAKGHTLIVRLQPSWDRSIPRPGDPYTTTTFAQDCKDSADQLKDYVHLWHLGNEINLYEGASNYVYNPAYYAEVYKLVREKIHEVTSSLGPQRLLLCPMSPGIAEGIRHTDACEYLYEILRHLTPEEVDGFALHSYAAPSSDVPASLEGFINGYREQLMVIDGEDFGSKPVYITEWNKEILFGGGEPVAAQFLYQAFARMHAWNQTSGNHDIIAACWFIYPMDPQWNNYSLLYNKTPIGTPDTDVWKAYEYSATQNYPAGQVGGGAAPLANALYWEDEFDGSTVDTAEPLPDWTVETGNGGTATVADGRLVLKGNGSSWAYSGIVTAGYAYKNFTLLARVEFTDPASLHPSLAEANTEVRFHEGSGGYSLTLDAQQDKVSLRRVNAWTTILEQPVSIAQGDRFDIRIQAEDAQLTITVNRTDTSEQVVDWSIVNDQYHWGWIRLNAYTIEEVRYDYIRVGGASYQGPSLVSKWALYH